MADYTEKEAKIVSNISDTLTKLDDTLDALETTTADGKKHTAKVWFEEHKALHEIKHILHEAKKYDKYDEKDFNEHVKEFEDVFDSF